jgi:hypothetical protein
VGIPYENRAKSSRFRDSANNDREDHHVHFLEDEHDDVTPTFYKNTIFVHIGVHIKMHIKL